MRQVAAGLARGTLNPNLRFNACRPYTAVWGAGNLTYKTKKDRCIKRLSFELSYLIPANAVYECGLARL